MNLDEYKAYIKATREASRLKAMSVLSDTISTKKEKEGAN
jgi:hypothetical protein